jgi:dTMP kinase
MFITLEGPEGSGKSTQMAALAAHLEAQGYRVLATREPGGTPIGDKVRGVLLDRENTAIHPRTEILLFQASRAQLVEEVIQPALQAGGVVLCDRYADSTLAYQGYGYEYDLDQLKSIVTFATRGLQPDLTLLLDLKVEQGLERKARGGPLNRLDAYHLAFHRRIRRGYHLLAQEEPGRWVVVDASGTPDHVQEDLRRIVLERLENHVLLDRPNEP